MDFELSHMQLRKFLTLSNKKINQNIYQTYWVRLTKTHHKSCSKSSIKKPNYCDEFVRSQYCYNKQKLPGLSLSFKLNLEAHSEPSHTYKIELNAKIVNGCKQLTSLAKRTILDVWLDSQYSSEPWGCFLLAQGANTCSKL